MPPSLSNPTAQPCFPNLSAAHTDAPVRHCPGLIAAPRVLALWHLASLDAPTVAVVWTLAFASAARVRLPAWAPILIGLTAWSAYIADRLLDAGKAFTRGNEPAARRRLRSRHLFHWRHRRVFSLLALAAACAAACLVIFFMPTTAIQRNSLVGACALAYFAGIHSGAPLQPKYAASHAGRIVAPPGSKEFLVGLIFTATCVLPTMSRMAGPWTMALPASLYVLLAWLNCHAIERWEAEAREKSASGRSVLAMAAFLGIACLIVAAFLAAAHPGLAELLASAALSASLLALLDRTRRRLTPLALRAAADLALLAPACVFLFHIGVYRAL